MRDPTTDRKRAAYIRRRLPTLLEELGFEYDDSGTQRRRYGRHFGRIGLQKLRQGFLIRVIMSFHREGAPKPIVEFADKYTHHNPPGGRKYDFSYQFGNEPEQRCLREIRDFIHNVALAWFEQQSISADQARLASNL
jgi:hypothetical protein